MRSYNDGKPSLDAYETSDGLLVPAPGVPIHTGFEAGDSQATGDDANLQKGYQFPGTRYIDNGDGTVTDQFTGIMWVQNPVKIIPDLTGQEIANGATLPESNQIQSAEGDWTDADEKTYDVGELVLDTVDSKYYVCTLDHTASDVGAPNQTEPGVWKETVWTASADDLSTPAEMYWATALTNINDLEYAGYDDWRMPNINELFSLMDFSKDKRYDDNVFTFEVGYYWSSTHKSHAGQEGKKIRLHFTNIYMYLDDDDQTDANYTLLCRGGRY